jgi:leader peptidase (prepilin peptidase)/N-methyltransferase
MQFPESYIVSSLSIWIDDPLLFSLLLTITGAMLGSLSNVIIYRLPVMRWFPEEKASPTFNLWLPRSRCPQCENTLRWYHNIPLFSWVFLRGRCGFCKADIPARYPLVELAGAIFGLSCSLLAPTPLAAIGIMTSLFLSMNAIMIAIDRQRIAIDLIFYSSLVFVLTAF